MIAGDLLEKGAVAARKTTDWAKGISRPDGTYGDGCDDLVGYYKSPLLLAGPADAAYGARILRRMQSLFQSEDGLFFTRGRSAWDAYYDLFSNYMNGWIATAAHRVALFDISSGLIDRLSERQHSRTGGIYSESPDPITGRQDAGTTGSVGLAFLHTGRTNEALRAGRFLIQLIEDQEEGERFFVARDKSGALLTEFAPEVSGNCAISLEAGDQPYWFLGMMIAFLGKLHAATKEKKFLVGARRTFDLFRRCRNIEHPDYTTGKVGWGAAILFAETGEERYADCAREILEMLTSHQRPDGTWFLSKIYGNYNEQPLAVTLDISVEMALWCAEIARELNNRMR